MADKNQNFISESVNPTSIETTQKGLYKGNNNSGLSGVARKEGLYTKKDAGGGGHGYVSRNANMVKDSYLSKSMEDKIWNNNVESSGKKGFAPIVGWQNGSPTVFPSSPVRGPDNMVSAVGSDGENQSSTSRSSDTLQNSGQTEDLLFPSTPALTIDPSTDSLELDQDSENKPTLLSPGTDCEEDRVPPTPTQSFTASPNLTVGPSPTGPQSPEDGEKTKGTEKTHGILVHRKHSEPETTVTANPGYLDYELGDFDSIDGSESILEIYDEDEDEVQTKSKIPDGGWGWVVVVASLLISMVADGISFSFGLLYIEFLHEFQASKAKTAWIGSLFMAVPLLTGPIMSALVDRYGCRKMTILGGFIAGIGFVLSSFSQSIEVMYLTFGVLAGVGLGLCYVTAVVSIAYWFDKKRTLAVGLGACGTGIGTFVYAPLTTFLIREYGWRGTTLLLSGTFFNLIVCGAVMRDPEWWVDEQRKQAAMGSPKKSMGRSELGGSSGSPTDDFPGVEELRKLLKSGQAPEYLLQSLSTTTQTQPNVRGGNFRSVVNLPTFVRQSEKVPLEVLESLSGNSRLYNVILENYPSLLLCRSFSDKKLVDSNGEVSNTNKTGVTMSMRLHTWIKQATERGKSVAPTKDSRPGSTHASTKLLATRRMSRKDLEETNPLLAKELAHAMAEAEKAKTHSRHHLPGFGGTVVRTDSIPWLRRQFNRNTHYFKDIRVHRNSVMYRGAVLNLHKYRLRASSCPDIYRNSITTLAKENEEKWYGELLELLKGMTDFSMFLELHFLMLSLSTILLFTWFIVPYFYLADHLTRNGYTEDDAANLLSIIGITNTIGMIGLGWAGDQPWMNVSKTYTWCLVACGIMTILMSICTPHYWLLVVICAAFGLFFASNFSFTPVILVELIPLERFTTAYGLSLLCQGIGNLLGPPLAGLIFDITESWHLSFLLAGSWIIVSGLLMGVIPYTKNRRIWGKGPVEMDREKDPEA
ncbi:uncharacterized protein LOC124404905 isoform X1 [Diprion similis]|uniref:uncharacterized protein LOC124404905 isoform X1 n=1 Tax=Diprion similis TaxID=362088 RepID=UPI001EF92127|nr:uncharacterized protein LOC124404905 isoform X1 [Diprion similis]XP_046735348.1 uncharacterized protein LOC124404905 isoform X1 [Diprion similis]